MSNGSFGGKASHASAALVPRSNAYSTEVGAFEKRKKDWRERLAEHATWTFEVLAAFVSVASLATIVGVLRYYDNERLDSWNLQVATADQTIHISLNTVISLLGTLCKSTIAVVLEAAISQLKWNWFNGVRRPLRDFELFDQASRGPNGSAKLVWRTKGVRLVSIGAFLTVLSVTFDPFLQLLVNYDSQQVPVSDVGALMPYAQSYKGGDRIVHGDFVPETDSLNTWFETDPRVIAAINNGLWSKDARLQPSYTCDSGNCTWPTQISLAVCSKCYDVSHQLQKSEVGSSAFVNDAGAATQGGPNDKNLMWTLKGGPGISIENQNNQPKSNGVDSTVFNSTATVFPNETISFQKSQNLIISLAAVVVNSSYTNGLTLWEDTPVTATECALELCAQTYDTQVNKGKYTEQRRAFSTERVPTSYAINDTQPSSLPDGVYNGTDWNPLGPAVRGSGISRTEFEVQLSKEQQDISRVTSFIVDQDSLQSLVWAFITVFKPSNFTQLNGEAQSIAGSHSGDRGFNKTYQGIYFTNALLNYDSPTMQALHAADSVDSVFDSLATDLSAMMRNGGAGGTGGKNIDTGKAATVEPLHGTDLISTVVIEVRWQFIVVPVLVCIVGTIFLVASMVQTKLQNMPVWKENALATLIWGVDEDTRQQIRDEWRIHGKGSGTHVRTFFSGGRAGGELTQ